MMKKILRNWSKRTIIFHILSIPTSNVRVGKRIELKVEAASKEDAFELVENACKKLLYYPVMEFYQINISEI